MLNKEKKNCTEMAALSSLMLSKLFNLLLASFGDDMKALQSVLFADGVDGMIRMKNKTWTVEQLQKIRYFLIEFDVNYHKKTGGEVTHKTMRN